MLNPERSIAHVVSAALGGTPHEATVPPPGVSARVRFPLAGTANGRPTSEASVQAWLPGPATQGDFDQYDVAVPRRAADLPDGVRALPVHHGDPRGPVQVAGTAETATDA